MALCRHCAGKHMDEPKLTGNHIEQDLVGILTPDEIRSKRELGRSIMLGENNEYVPGHAVKFLTDAARAGDARALAYLAECYYTGKGTARDPLKAFDLAMDSAETDDPYGRYVAGLIYYEGGAGEKDYYQAVRYLTEAANEGIVKAQRLLGSCYYDGTGVSKDIYKARHWFEIASMRGDKEARATYEALTREIEDKQSRTALAKKAMDGDREAQLTALENYVKALRDKKSFESVLIQDEIALINELERSDDPEIRYLLFECYNTIRLNTDYMERKKELTETALRHLKYSALEGRYPYALHRLGVCYQSGNLTEKDMSSAVDCFKTAADLGCTESMKSLSYIYGEGSGVEKDLDKAIDWIEKAIKQADKDGMSDTFMTVRRMSLIAQRDEKNGSKTDRSEQKSQPKKRRLSMSVLWEYIDFNVYGILGAIGLYLMTVLYRALGAGLLTQPLINVHGFARFILVVISAAGIFFGIFVSLLSILMQAGLEFLAFFPSGILALFIIVELHDHARYFTYITYFALAVTAINLIFIAVRTIRKY